MLFWPGPSRSDSSDRSPGELQQRQPEGTKHTETGLRETETVKKDLAFLIHTFLF